MDEYIKREDALAICEEKYREQLRILNYAGDSVAWNIGHAIKELPAADVAPVVHGRWINAPLCGNAICRCSVCGNVTSIHANLSGQIMQMFCQSCGAKMDGGDNDAAD